MFFFCFFPPSPNGGGSLWPCFPVEGCYYAACASLCKMAAMFAPLVHTTDLDEIVHFGTRFDHRRARGGSGARYFVREPRCDRTFRSKSPPKAQRSHVTPSRSTILLTFPSVKASGGRP